MAITAQLASALGRTDEQPNVELAERIVAGRDTVAIRELVDVLGGKDKALKGDALKALYEVGAREPALIAPHLAHFKNLLASAENRMVWGAMCAIDAITSVKPENVYMMLPQIMQAVDKGGVITRDHAVKALVKLATEERFARSAIPLLQEQLRTCPVNQLPMYAELVATVVKDRAAVATRKALEARLAQLADLPAKKKRLEKVLKKLSVM
jgi:hypothetical protein